MSKVYLSEMTHGKSPKIEKFSFVKNVIFSTKKCVGVSKNIFVKFTPRNFYYLFLSQREEICRIEETKILNKLRRKTKIAKLIENCIIIIFDQENYISFPIGEKKIDEVWKKNIQV